MNKLVIVATIVTAAAGAQEAFPQLNSTTAGATNHLENTAPFVAPVRMQQSLVTDYIRIGPGFPSGFHAWDMSTFDPSGRFVFTPCETLNGGVFRFDQVTNQAVVVMSSVVGAPRIANPSSWTPTTDRFEKLDGCSFTPAGTIITAEETIGGRAFEVLNPVSGPPFQVRWLTSIPAVAHEGLRFDRLGNLYFIDESSSGSIYKFEPTVAGDFSAGQVFVLRVNAYASDPNAAPAQNWNSVANRLTTRFGPATWVPMTDPAGGPLTATDPFVFVTANSGGDAADEVIATPYGRPEDIGFNVLANGNECLYVALTGENRVLAIELLSATTAMVGVMCDFDTINLATGVDVNPLQSTPYSAPGPGTVFDNPDNIAVDAWGSVYVLEDADPGDVWKLVDIDKDGVAEGMGLLLSLGISGSEPSGMIFDPSDPYRFIINVSHPASSNDATWAFATRPYPGTGGDLELRTGVNVGATAVANALPGEFVKAASPLDLVSIVADSPNGTVVGRPFLVLLQPILTASGTRIQTPPLWVGSFAPFFAVAGGHVSGLPVAGSSTTVPVPPGLAGWSAMLQALVVPVSGGYVATDAHEILLR